MQPTEALAASIMPAAVQPSAISALRHGFTLRQTRRAVPIMFSMALVQASACRFLGQTRHGSSVRRVLGCLLKKQ